MVTEIWPELWTRPGDPNFGRKRDYLPFRSAGVHVGLNKVGDGNFEFTDSFDGFDDILSTDSDTPANSESSLVRWFSSLAPTTPIAEWLPSEILPGGSKDDPYTKVTGVGINGILGYARLEPFDWDGSDTFECSECDWIYGGPNSITNPGFEESGSTPTIYQIYTDATMGDFRLTDGTSTTAAIAWNASAATVESRLEIDIAAITDVLVTGTGTADDPWVIEFKNPAFGVTLALSSHTLNGDLFITPTQTGGLDPAPAMKSQTVSTGAVSREYGAYTSFEVTDAQAHTGTYSLLIDPAAIPPRYAGVQWVVPVKPGQLYQASIWVRPTSATDTYRFVIRAPGSDANSVGAEGVFIASDTGGLGGTSYPANTWTEVTIDDIEIPDGITSVIVRFANVDASGNPAAFYVDDVEFAEGQRAATVGKILGDIYDHAIDPLLRSTLIVWDDGSGTDTPYLTLDFDDTVDSNGNAWDNNEITTRLSMRQSYSQIMANLANEHRYEYRIVPDTTLGKTIEDGAWLWQVYNPGGMDDAPDVAVQGGSSDVKRQLRRVTPSGTDQLVEGLLRVTARARNTALMGALGRIEASVLSREAPDLAAATVAASSAVTQSLQDISSVAYVLTGDLQDEPMSAYTIGDTVTIVDPPEITAASKRFVDLEISVDANKLEWEVQYGALVITNADAAVADAVAGLLKKFEYADIDTPGGPIMLGGGGGAPTVVVAASDATDLSKSKADFICPGVNDHLVILEAYAYLSQFIGGRMILTEGTFFCAYGELAFTGAPLTLLGLGTNSTLIQFSGTTGNGLVFSSGGDHVSDLGIIDEGGAAGAGIRLHAGEGSRVHRVLFGNSGTGLLLDSSTSASREVVVSDCYFRSTGGIGIDATVISPQTGAALIIANNQFMEVTGHCIRLSRWSSAVIAGNVFFNPPGGGALANRAILANSPVVDVIIANNRVSSRGITVSGGERFLIEGNHISEHAGHGITLADASGCLVRGNVIGGTPSGLVDRIHLSGDSDENYINDNYLYPTAAIAQPRYGVNISAATCDCNIVVGNRLGPATDYSSDALNDLGTNTQLVYPNDPVYGDNFTDCSASS